MVPDGWSAQSVGEFCEFFNGNGFKASEWSTQGWPIIRIQNLNGSSDFNYFNGEVKDRWVVEPGDILFAWAGTKGVSFGAKRWSGPRGVLNQHIFRVEPKMKVNPDWLYFALIRVTECVENKAHGFKATLLHVQKSDIAEQVIPVPPLLEQNRIARILSTWDEAIATTEQLLANSEQQKKALMQQLLTGKKRLPGFEGEWQSHVLGDLGSTYPGLAGKNKEDFGDGKPYISYMKVFSSLSINTDIFDRVRIERGERQHRVKYGDVLFTTSSEVPEEVGMTSVFLGDMDELYLNSFCFGFRLHDFEILLPEFAKFKLREWTVRKTIARMAQGATRYNLSKKQLLTLRLQLPGLAEQRGIALVLDLQEEELDLIRRDVKRLKAEKKALMQQLLTGKRRVKVDEAERTSA
ncbi:restriction endonuclease subunit S [Alloalcanivorax marinus]|uniref:restriction endonuclease subunit S n=1 Tax=Alloalcanivorax marinus TaxID=1177169 RepID=UPI001958CA76|nr:restriction endonuclease subunit S [Alloalcanivorax marinus]MBM7333554.1 restriction endonuclease subunit S [Alloalcanivorax marinus]